MRELLALQRRVQDLEHAHRNQGRIGKIVDVKFDKQHNGWLARMEQGEEPQIFKSDWLPWGSFSHGTIKMSVPPRKGQLVKLNCPQGQPEQGWLEPHHYDPDNVAPHDKPDEIFIRIEKPSESGKTATDKDQTFDIHLTKDGPTMKIGATTHKLTKDAQSIVTKHDRVETETQSTKASKSTELVTKKRTVTAVQTTVKSDSYALGGKVLINCGTA